MSTTEHLLDDTRLESVLVVVAEVAMLQLAPKRLDVVRHIGSEKGITAKIRSMVHVRSERGMI